MLFKWVTSISESRAFLQIPEISLRDSKNHYNTFNHVESCITLQFHNLCHSRRSIGSPKLHQWQSIFRWHSLQTWQLSESLLHTEWTVSLGCMCSHLRKIKRKKIEKKVPPKCHAILCPGPQSSYKLGSLEVLVMLQISTLYQHSASLQHTQLLPRSLTYIDLTRISAMLDIPSQQITFCTIVSL